MFRFQNLIKTVQVSVEPLANLQNVRWRRKPRWIPKAKSKIFKVSPRPEIPEDEYYELKRLYCNYHTQMKSLTRYFKTEYERANQITVDPKLIQQAFDEEFAICNKINDEWNASIKVLREARFEESLSKDLELARSRVLAKEIREEERLQKLNEEVRQMKEVSHTFITAENVDDAIEKALSTVVDHNYAIDLKGNKYVGREANAESLESNLLKQNVKN